MQFRTLVFFAVLLSACTTTPPEILSDAPSSGYWRMTLESGTTPIPVNLFLDTAGHWSMLNGPEIVPTYSIQEAGDSSLLRISAYPSYLRFHVNDENSLTGRWIDSSRTNYSVPFTAQYQGHGQTHYPSLTPNPDPYKVTFEPGTPDAYLAQGLFTSENGPCTGTFLTETGDYRYLQGSRTSQHLVLSCFDGAHLFFFEADVAGDSLIDGVFLSGKHYQSTWEGVRDPSFALTDPDSLTYLTGTEESFSFQALDPTGDIVAFDANQFTGRLTIIQIFGSWCPNCLDESKYYKDLYDRYHARGLDILPVAFERGNDFQQNVEQLHRQFEQLGIDYPFYIGGTASKSEASRVFSQLNSVISFPTSVFIGPNGNVLKIHTGFYGPGTGDAYSSYVQNTEAFIETQLTELH